MASPERVQFEGLYKQAYSLLNMKRYPEAVAYAQQAIAIFPDNPNPYILTALALANVKDPASVEWARKAISKAPDDGACWAALADSFNSQKRWAEGLEAMRKAVALDPNNSRFLSFLGQSLIFSKNNGEAITYLQKSIDLDPQDAWTHYRLYLALVGARKKGAHIHLRKALELSPNDAAFHNTIGWQLLGRGRRGEADKAFRNALRLNPQYEPAKVGLGEPTDSSKGLQDALLRFSISVLALPQRRLLALVQLFVIIGMIGFVAGYPGLWELQIALVIFAIWYVYFLLTRRIVRVIGKRRGVHFF